MTPPSPTGGTVPHGEDPEIESYRTGDDYEPDTRELLERFAYEVRQSIGPVAGDRPKREVMLANRLLSRIERLYQATEEGNVWLAINLAIHVTRDFERITLLFPEMERVWELLPDAEQYRKIRAERSEGGRSTRKAPSAEAICQHIRARHEQCPNDSWSAVCAYVGRKLGLSRQTIMKHGKAADWRRGSQTDDSPPAIDWLFDPTGRPTDPNHPWNRDTLSSASD